MARADEVVRRIERRIRDGELEAGERIGTRKELRISHGVSAGTLNEAIRLLQARGLVEARSGPRGGIFTSDEIPVGAEVALPSSAADAATLADYRAIREALEPLVLREAASGNPGTGAAGWRRLLDQMEAAVGSPERFERLERQLRVELARHCRNSVLQSLYLSFLDPLGSESPERREEDDRERMLSNRSLIEALISGDPESVERAAACWSGSP
jgi:GntR family transcriptional regulator, transcriptional repressor for pyruvate dehydrogenase complex